MQLAGDDSIGRSEMVESPFVRKSLQDSYKALCSRQDKQAMLMACAVLQVAGDSGTGSTDFQGTRSHCSHRRTNASACKQALLTFSLTACVVL